MHRAFLIAILLALPISAFCQETSRQVSVNARTNCCGDAERDKANCIRHAQKVSLPAGNYIITPKDGAVSRYPEDKYAIQRNRGPWIWQVVVSDGDKPLYLGANESYMTKKEAFEANSGQHIKINTSAQKELFFWIEDEYQGTSSCNNNRGEAVVSIQKQN
jgi:hypothetical protein